jgi:hypothetical protein
MSDLTNVCNLKTYTIPALTTRTFQIKAAAGEAGKIKWLKLPGTASVTVEVKYITNTSGDVVYYIAGNPPITITYEFGFAPWQDAAESTLKGIMVDEDDYVEFALANGTVGDVNFDISFFFVNASLTEV